MTLEKQVCSFDLAKRLKELGVKQESVFVWCYTRAFREWVVALSDGTFDDGIVSAFTVAELVEMLPPRLLSKIDKYKCDCIAEPDDGDEWSEKIDEGYAIAWLEIHANSRSGKLDSWSLSYEIDELHTAMEEEETPSLPDACAKMLIYLLENKLV